MLITKKKTAPQISQDCICLRASLLKFPLLWLSFEVPVGSAGLSAGFLEVGSCLHGHVWYVVMLLTPSLALVCAADAHPDEGRGLGGTWRIARSAG